MTPDKDEEEEEEEEEEEGEDQQINEVILILAIYTLLQYCPHFSLKELFSYKLMTLTSLEYSLIISSGICYSRKEKVHKKNSQTLFINKHSSLFWLI